MSGFARTGSGRWALLAAVLVALAAGCGGGEATTTSTEPTNVVTTSGTAVTGPQLRVANAGSTDVDDLVVLFPESRVEFGDVASDQTTDYQEVPGGVYKYAAYEYTLDGEVVLQRVLDWVGEVPMQGAKFTYQIAFDPAKPVGLQIELLAVEIDEW